MADREISKFGDPGHFYECPRWRDGRWWLSDMHGNVVISYAPDGTDRREIALDYRPGGIDWTPDGDLLIVAMDEKLLLRCPRGSGTASRWIDLAPLCEDASGFLNDMVVGPDGNAYIGFDSDENNYDNRLGRILRVDPNGNTSVVARDLAMPNGMVFSSDGKTLIVAETMTSRFSAFSLGSDGALTGAGVWAQLGPRGDDLPVRKSLLATQDAAPDGCTIDVRDHIWVADVHSACLRVAPGGDIVDAVALPGDYHAFACALGGEDGRTLLICGADTDFTDRKSRKASYLFTTRVDVPAP